MTELCFALIGEVHKARVGSRDRTQIFAMNYLKRYQSGEYEQVWDELQALGPDVRNESNYPQALEVATETMRRVRGNCELIVSRLTTAGYHFGLYPDGTKYSNPDPLVGPSRESRVAIIYLEREAGPLPLSLVAFWQEVGTVDLIGMHPGWPTSLDPLVVYPPEATESCLDDYEDELFGVLAPDDLHKDNVSGGDPYGFELPSPSADFILMNEDHNLLFVQYLRMAILKWGGFPGLERLPRFEPLSKLVAGLEPF